MARLTDCRDNINMKTNMSAEQSVFVAAAAAAAAAASDVQHMKHMTQRIKIYDYAHAHVIKRAPVRFYQAQICCWAD
jgi:hypothetical protein